MSIYSHNHDLISSVTHITSKLIYKPGQLVPCATRLYDRSQRTSLSKDSLWLNPLSVLSTQERTHIE